MSNNLSPHAVPIYHLQARARTEPHSSLQLHSSSPWHPEVLHLFAVFTARYRRIGVVVALMAEPEPPVSQGKGNWINAVLRASEALPEIWHN